jgi:hypothetical protein
MVVPVVIAIVVAVLRDRKTGECQHYGQT